MCDTNFLIKIGQNSYSVLPFLNVKGYISFVTEIGLLGVFSINKIQKQNATELISEFEIISINDDIHQITINLKQKYKLKLADAIIATTAIHLKNTIYNVRC